MIHYHGTPVGGTRLGMAAFVAGRHCLVPFPRQDDMAAVAEFSQSFVLDNGAFSIWKRGGVLDVQAYAEFCIRWSKHPSFDWALIPDVIDGTEAENNLMLSKWWVFARGKVRSVPVWHLHESIERLLYLGEAYNRVAIGSSGEWPTPGTSGWWQRMGEVMGRVCDEEGRPKFPLHGLRMLDPAIFSRLPLASADSTNAAVNGGSVSRFGMYPAPTAGQRASVIADRIESHNSAATWQGVAQEVFEF